MKEAPLVKRFPLNAAGRDFCVGDIHGHFSRLQAALDEIGFDPAVDRLFSVGDLVDRGPECEQVLQWLDKPWFHPVRGNHDDYVCRFDSCMVGNWLENGGLWFQGLTDYEKGEFAAWFRQLPIAIEVATPSGPVGIVHADCPGRNWPALLHGLENMQGGELRALRNSCMWSRRRCQELDTTGVGHVRALVVGHTPMNEPTALGNVIHIDTAGWNHKAGGYFTLLDLHSLRAFCCVEGESSESKVQL